MATRPGFRTHITRVFESFEDLSPIFPDIAEIIDASIQENFDVGGRYGNDNEMGGGSQRWTQSQAARDRSGQTLMQHGHLSADVQVEPYSDGIQIGTKREYGPYHHYGYDHPGGNPYINIGGVPTFMKKRSSYPKGTKFTKPFSVEARPWAVVQNEDLKEVNRVVVGFLKGKI